MTFFTRLSCFSIALVASSAFFTASTSAHARGPVVFPSPAPVPTINYGSRNRIPQVVTEPQVLHNAALTPLAEHNKGTPAWILDQDPSIEGLGYTRTVLPQTYSTLLGLGDRELDLKYSVFGKRPNYTSFDHNMNIAAKRATALFSNIREGYNILRQDYLRTFELTAGTDTQPVVGDFYKNWNKSGKKLRIYPDVGVDMNAYYSRDNSGNRSVQFFHFTSQRDGSTIYTGESSEVAGHEAWGHAHIDQLWPALFDDGNLEMGGFHEGGADAYSLLINTSMSYKQRTFFLNQTGGNFKVENNILASLGESFGGGIGTSAIRDMSVDILRATAHPSVHEIGRIWGSAFYDMLDQAYTMALPVLGDRYAPEQVLKMSADYLRRSQSLAILWQVKQGTTGFNGLASSMNKMAQESIKLTGVHQIDALPWSDIISSEFTRRGVSVQGGSGRANLFNADPTKHYGICGTAVENNVIDPKDVHTHNA